MGVTNPEETMRLLAELIMYPWLNQQADKLIFRARGDEYSQSSEEDKKDSRGKAYGSGSLHPMWDFGDEWEKTLSHDGLRSELRQSKMIVLQIYHDCWGPELTRDIQIGMVGDLDYFAEIATHGLFDPTKEE